MMNYIGVAKVLLPIAIVIGLTGFGWMIASWHSDSVAYKAKAEKAAQDLNIIQNTLTEVQNANERKDKDAKRIAANAAAAIAERDRLRGTLEKARTQLATAPTPAIVEYANTVTAVFEQCTKEYLVVAEAADGHAADATNLTITWQAIAGVR